GDGRDAERGAAAGVAVDLGKDKAGDGYGGDERLRHADRFLSGHRIDDQKGLDGLHGGVEVGDLLHEGLVDAEPPGSVEDHDVADLSPGGFDALAGDIGDAGPDGGAEDRDVELLAERFELVRGGRAVRVGGHEERAAALLDDVARELGGRRGLARTLQADHGHDRGVAGQVEHAVAGAEQVDELVMDDLHDLLAG